MTQAIKPGKRIVVTGMDGSGKTTLIKTLTKAVNFRTLHIPYNDFVLPALHISGNGLAFGDCHTDRLVFALDARLTNYHLKNQIGLGYSFITQRGWMDNFIHGRVQGVSYAKTNIFLKIEDLIRPDGIVIVNCNPNTGYQRIKDDFNGDKFETLEYMKKQRAETKRFYQQKDSHQGLSFFANIPSLYIDTSHDNINEFIPQALQFVKNICNIQH